MLTRTPLVRESTLYYERDGTLTSCPLESDEGQTWLKQGIRFTIETSEELYTAYAERKGQKIYWRLQKKSLAGNMNVAIAPPLPTCFSIANAVERLQEKLRHVTSSGIRATWSPRASTHPLSQGPIYGRTQELEVLRHVLSTPAHRLMTLTGFGGVGKTALALALIENSPQAIWIDCEQEPEDNGFLPAIQRAMAPTNTHEQLSVVLEKRLGSEDLLFVLDRCEHLLLQKGDLLKLLTQYPRLRILATSRICFAVQEEWVYQVTPLNVSELAEARDPDKVFAHPAMKLLLQENPNSFQDRDHLSDLQKVCYFLAGIPLALVLASTQLRVQTPKELLACYQGRWLSLSSSTLIGPARHATLRDPIATSLSLLSGEAQRLFRWLAPFHGGAALEQIIALTRKLNGFYPLPLLEELCISALVEHTVAPGGKSSFRLLEPIRELAWKELHMNGTEMARAQLFHAQIYVELAETLEPELVGANWSLGAQRVRQDYGNFLAAILWCTSNKKYSLAQRLCTALDWYWYTSGSWSEGSAWLEKALPNLTNVSTREEARAARTCGRLLHMQSQYQKANDYLQASLAYFEDHALPKEVAMTCLYLADLKNEEKSTQALDYARRGWTLVKEYFEQPCWQRRYALIILAAATLFRQNFPDTTHYLKLCLEESLASHDEQGIAWVLTLRGIQAFYQQDLPWAKQDLQEAVRIFKRRKELRGIGDALLTLALVVLNLGNKQGNDVLAHSYYSQLAQLCVQYNRLGIRSWECAICLRGLGELAARSGEWEQAAILWEVAKQVRPNETPFEHSYRKYVRLMEKKLNEMDRRAACQRGQFLSVERALLSEIPSRLTAEERQILHLLHQGLQSKAIAQLLGVHWKVINRKIQAIYKKFEIEPRERQQLITWARDNGVLEEE